MLSDVPFPRLALHFGKPDADRAPMEIDAEEFVGVKGFKAKGKRLTTFNVKSVEELEPTRQPEEPVEEVDDGSAEGETQVEQSPVENAPEPESENLDPDKGKSQQQIIDEMTGQLSLSFGDDI